MLAAAGENAAPALSNGELSICITPQSRGFVQRQFNRKTISFDIEGGLYYRPKRLNQLVLPGDLSRDFVETGGAQHWPLVSHFVLRMGVAVLVLTSAASLLVAATTSQTKAAPGGAARETGGAYLRFDDRAAGAG